MAKYLADKEKLESLYPADVTFNSHRLTFSDGPDDPIGHIDNDSAIKILKDNDFRVMGIDPFLDLHTSSLDELPKSGWKPYRIHDVVMYLDDDGKIKYSGFIHHVEIDTGYAHAIAKIDPYGVYRGRIGDLGDKWVVLQTDRDQGRRLPTPMDLQEASPTLSEAKLTELYLKIRTGTYDEKDVMSPVNDDIASMFTAPIRGEERYKPQVLKE